MAVIHAHHAKVRRQGIEKEEKAMCSYRNGRDASDCDLTAKDTNSEEISLDSHGMSTWCLIYSISAVT